ncbi:MAG: HAMP domain-containing histidine kinase [Bacteroidales bacterium]|nr:HAMP domain-containing histidine kinase [Bacteroidales bacterium]
MKNPKRLTWIRLLMIFSQLVLTVFVGQWLWSVYQKESDRYDQDFARKFQDSEMAVMDSMLMVKVLDPMMRDSSYRQMTMEITLDSLGMDQGTWQGTKIYRDFAPDSCRRIIAISSEDSFSPPSGANPASHFTVNSSDAVFLQGMKLVVKRIEDSLFLSDRFGQGRVIMKDTGRIKELFAENIRKVSPSIQIIWTTNEPPWDTTFLKSKAFYYKMPAQGYILAAAIKNPFPVIIRGIIPSILFGLALLVLTGLSFVFAFRSLKSQIELNRIRSDFMSNITHELKTPVSTVKVALEALKKFNTNSDPSKVEEYLGMASREMDRLDQLISQVLNSSMYDNGIQLLEREDIDLGKLTAEVAESLQVRIEREGASLVVEEPHGSCSVTADRLHLQGVLMNLLENALNYSGDQPEIRIEISRSDQEITCVVSDNGPGIPEEYLEKVFDKFFRVPNGDLHNVKGYGLGLSYASMVMKLHGGTIRAENTRTGGARFILNFSSLKA